MKKGDRVKIVGLNAPSDKIGQKGVVQVLTADDAFVRLNDGRFVVVRSKNIELTEYQIHPIKP